MEMAPWQRLLCGQAWSQLSLHAPKLVWKRRHDSFPNLPYWQNCGFAKGMKPRSRTAPRHLLLHNSCYSAGSLMSKVNLITPLLCLLVFIVHKGRIPRGEWESRNNVGIEKSGPLFLWLNCRLSSENRPESRSLVQIRPHGCSWLRRAGGKVNLRQMIARGHGAKLSEKLLL